MLAAFLLCADARSVYSNQYPASGNGVEGSGAAAVAPVHVMAFGDSLTAGYGLENAHSFPAVLEETLRGMGYNVRVTNAGVSGDTSAGGAARIAWALESAPELLILELGANDALQGISPDVTRANLAAIIEACRARGVTVLLAGMQAPRNMGEDYAARFDALYPGLAREYGVALYPFFLEGVALDRALNLDDGMHPNPAGVRVIVSRMAPVVAGMLDALR